MACKTCEYYTSSGECTYWESDKLSSDSCSHYSRDFSKSQNDTYSYERCENCENFDRRSDYCDRKCRRVNRNDCCSAFEQA